MRLILLALLLVLPACSKLSIGVRWADTFVFSQLDDYYTLDSAAMAESKKEFNAALLEVRRHEFPRFAEMLEGLAGEAEANTLTEARMTYWTDHGIATIRAAGARFEAMGQQLIAREAGKGWMRYDNTFWDRWNGFQNKIRTPEDRLKQARKRSERVIEETVGSLTKEQELWADETMRENPLELEHLSRRHVWEKFVMVRGDPVARAKFVKTFFTDWDSQQTAEYIRARDAYRKKSIVLMARILGSASPTQKTRMISRFRERAKELRDLSLVK